MPHDGPVLSHWHHLVDDFDTSALDFYDAVEEAVKARAVPDAEFSRVDFKERGIASAKRTYLRIKRQKVAFDLCAAPYGNGYFFSSWLVKPGPPHPWIWLLGFIGLVGIWSLLLLWTLGSALQQSLLGGSGGAGCLFVILLFGLPAILFWIGWSIREGHLAIDEDDVLTIPVVGYLYRLVFNPLAYYQLDTALMFQESVGRSVGEVLNELLTAQGVRALSPDELKPTIRDLAR